MKDEIKEILDELKECNDYDISPVLLQSNEVIILLDYITNLQERNEKAIEYVKRVCESEKNINPYILHAPTLLNILQGEDKE